MKEINFTDKTKAKKVIDIFLVLAVFALCLVTVLATNSTDEDNSAPTLTGSYADKPETTDENNDLCILDDTVEKDVLSSVNNTENTVSENEESVSENIDEDVDEVLEFMLPVSGSLLREYSTNSLLYSPTMDDWRIHCGVDIESAPGMEVVSAEKGVVSFSGFDAQLGYSVIITTGEYECIYGSLESEIPVTEGQNVSKGEIIGYIGDSMISEICDTSHLHFEMRFNGEYINPCDYMDF